MIQFENHYYLSEDKSTRLVVRYNQGDEPNPIEMWEEVKHRDPDYWDEINSYEVYTIEDVIANLREHKIVDSVQELEIISGSIFKVSRGNRNRIG